MDKAVADTDEYLSGIDKAIKENQAEAQFFKKRDLKENKLLQHFLTERDEDTETPTIEPEDEPMGGKKTKKKKLIEEESGYSSESGVSSGAETEELSEAGEKDLDYREIGGQMRKVLVRRPDETDTQFLHRKAKLAKKYPLLSPAQTQAHIEKGERVQARIDARFEQRPQGPKQTPQGPKQTPMPKVDGIHGGYGQNGWYGPRGGYYGPGSSEWNKAHGIFGRRGGGGGGGGGGVRYANNLALSNAIANQLMKKYQASKSSETARNTKRETKRSTKRDTITVHRDEKGYFVTHSGKKLYLPCHCKVKTDENGRLYYKKEGKIHYLT